MRDFGFLPAAERLEPRRLLTAVPVADLETSPEHSYPEGLTNADGTVYFAAAGPGGEGRELWKTDGTAAGTALVKDLYPGPAWSDPTPVYRNGTVFVVADVAARRELWTTDGTDGGTVRLTGANLSNTSSVETPASRLTAFNGHVLFWGNDAEQGWRLWSTDGTPAGTVPVKDLSTGPDRTFSDGTFTEFNGKLYFAAGDATSGFELWSTDGTEDGTVRVKDINPGPAGSNPENITAVEGTLYFTATDLGHGSELWKTDGTEAGTVLVKDLRPGPASSTPWNLTASGGRLFFTARPTDGAGNELWVSDGTEAGTVSLARNASGAYFDTLTDVNGTLFFAQHAPSGSNAFGLWKTDGTAAGTVWLAQVNVGDFTLLGTTLLFRNGLELWKTDGTSAGTVRLRRFDDARDPYADVGPLTVSGDVAYFAAYTAGSGRELWKTDGTAEGTALARDINPGPAGSNPDNLVSAGGAVYFSAMTDALGIELWKSDGSEAGTVLVKDVFPGTFNSNPFALDDDNGTLYFATSPYFGATGVYRVRPAADGTVAPQPLALFGQDDDAVIEEMVAHDGNLVLSTTTSYNTWGSTLRLSDGTAPGTRSARTWFSIHHDLTEVDGRTFFGASTGWIAQALAMTDGTDAGTVILKDFGLGRGPREFVNFNGTLFFTADDGEHGRELWKSDGTPEGTAMVADVIAGTAGSAPDGSVSVGGTLFFRAVTAAGTELWKTDGTPAGTTRVAALSARPADYLPSIQPGRNLTMTPRPWGAALDGVLLFANGGPDGSELWRSDGTEAGTFRVKDIEPGPGGSEPSNFVTFDERVYFSAYDHAAGRELWSTDGTEAGTARAQDIYPGPVGSAPTWLTVSGEALWFSAAGPEIGRELWRYTPDPRQPAEVVGRYVFYNHSAFDGNDPAAGRTDDGAIAADKAPLLPGRQPSFANVTSYDKGINGVMIDVSRLPITDAPLSVADFDFGSANDPVAVTVRRGAGAAGTDRVTLVWRSDQAVVNGWLTVTVKANAHTGLAAPDVFSFGNLIGETGDAGATGWRVSALDLTAVKRALNTTAPITSATDLNHDGRTNSLDLSIVRRMLNEALPQSPPLLGPPSELRPRRVAELAIL
jgi:ELWxxDGT repeat protein